MKLFKRPLLPLFASLVLFACSPNVQTVYEINTADWLVQDKDILYIHHTFSGFNDGLVRSTSKYKSSTIRVNERTLANGEFSEAKKLFQMDSATPCGDMIFRPEDSLVYLSYAKLTMFNVADRHFCDGINTNGGYTVQLKVLKWSTGSLTDSKMTVDTVAYLDDLEKHGDGYKEKGITIDYEYEKLCVGTSCFGT